MREIRHEPRAATGVEQHSGGATIRAHVHDDDQIIYLSAGVLAITTSRGVWSATPERAVLIPAGVWHEHRVYGRSRIHTLGLGTTTSSATGTRAAEPSILVLPVTALLRELLVTLSGKTLGEDATAAARALLAVLTVSAPSAGVHLPEPRDARLARACALVEENLGQSIPITDLATRVGSTERTLSRLFRSEFGISYPQWRSVLRVFHASVALVEGNSVTATATRCGWATPSAFATTFLRLTGQTPIAYQRSLERPAADRETPRPSSPQR